jgi:hypothetical protein
MQCGIAESLDAGNPFNNGESGATIQRSISSQGVSVYSRQPSRSSVAFFRSEFYCRQTQVRVLPSKLQSFAENSRVSDGGES